MRQSRICHHSGRNFQLPREELSRDLPATVPRIEIERALIDRGSELANEVAKYLGEDGEQRLEDIRKRLFGSEPPLADEARHRYTWVRDVHERSATGFPNDHDLELESYGLHEPTRRRHNWTLCRDGHCFSGGVRLGDTTYGCN